jgi:hypothetical protein
VLAEAAERVAERLGWVMHDAAAQRFAASLPDWPAFPDTDAALKRRPARQNRIHSSCMTTQIWNACHLARLGCIRYPIALQ